MICTRVTTPGGGVAIVCGSRPTRKLCKCGSGQRWSLLCDWKVAPGKTCDAKICASCSHAPAEDKDLCPTHAAEWRARLARAAEIREGVG